MILQLKLFKNLKEKKNLIVRLYIFWWFAFTWKGHCLHSSGEAKSPCRRLPGQETSWKLVYLPFKLPKACSMTKQRCDLGQGFLTSLSLFYFLGSCTDQTTEYKHSNWMTVNSRQVAGTWGVLSAGDISLFQFPSLSFLPAHSFFFFQAWGERRHMNSCSIENKSKFIHKTHTLDLGCGSAYSVQFMRYCAFDCSPNRPLIITATSCSAQLTWELGPLRNWPSDVFPKGILLTSNMKPRSGG